MIRNCIRFAASLAAVMVASMPGMNSARADEADDLARAASSAMQKLDRFAADNARKVKTAATSARNLDTRFSNAAQEYAALIAEFKNRKSELEGKIKAIQEQIDTLNDQARKLKAIAQKIEELMPQFMAAGEDPSITQSRATLAAISGRETAAKLLAAIKGRNATAVLGTLRQGSAAALVQVGELRTEGGSGVSFQVGNLVYCLSTARQCGGQPVGMGSASSRAAPDAQETVRSLTDLLAAGNRLMASSNQASKEMFADLQNRQSSSGSPAEVQRLIEQMEKAQAQASKLAQQVDSALEQLIGQLGG